MQHLKLSRFSRTIQGTRRALSRRDLDRKLAEIRALRLQAECALARLADRDALLPMPAWVLEFERE